MVIHFVGVSGNMADQKFMNMIPSEQVFAYNIFHLRILDSLLLPQEKRTFDERVRLNNNSGIKTICTRDNVNFLMYGYDLCNELYQKALSYYLNFSVNESDLYDFGINLLVVNFAAFIAHGQYFLFAYTFSCLKEIDEFESLLLQCSDTYVKLFFNLAIHREYGLKAIRDRKGFGTNLFTVSKFYNFISCIKNKNITIESFIKDFIINTHPRIAESLYAFTSFKRTANIINDCRRICSKTFSYALDPIEVVDPKTYPYRGYYWFNIRA